MANLAILIKVGKHPNQYEKGVEYHFSVGSEDSKISSEDLLEVLKKAVEDKILEKYGEMKEVRS